MTSLADCLVTWSRRAICAAEMPGSARMVASVSYWLAVMSGDRRRSTIARIPFAAARTRYIVRPATGRLSKPLCVLVLIGEDAISSPYRHRARSARAACVNSNFTSLRAKQACQAASTRSSGVSHGGKDVWNDSDHVSWRGSRLAMGSIARSRASRSGARATRQQEKKQGALGPISRRRSGFFPAIHQDLSRRVADIPLPATRRSLENQLKHLSFGGTLSRIPVLQLNVRYEIQAAPRCQSGSCRSTLMVSGEGKSSRQRQLKGDLQFVQAIRHISFAQHPTSRLKVTKMPDRIPQRSHLAEVTINSCDRGPVLIAALLVVVEDRHFTRNASRSVAVCAHPDRSPREFSFWRAQTVVMADQFDFGFSASPSERE